MIRTKWTSTGRPTLNQAGRDTPVITHDEVERLYLDWKAAPDKSVFMSSIAAHEAAALCDLIKHREPPLPVRSRESTQQTRIAAALNTDDPAIILAVHTALIKAYGVRHFPKRITERVIRAVMDDEAGVTGIRKACI